ncbi:MAG: HAMP domain-containing sensor histidine kinase [Candidatus Eisenbacteria bacterium]|nr:HAMP domain-containing sensor histidine kinase [Candidatus Eisenbacteria bacterium]
MDTYFAPAGRADHGELQRDIVLASKNPMVNGLLRTAGGLLAVLNPQRQILAVNDAFLKTMGAEDATRVLGLRPGEAINCVHAHELAGGCGTSKFCSTCGTAIAIVACLASEQPEERKCATTIEKNGKKFDLYFRVRSSLITFEGRLLILLLLQDITASQRWAAVERLFFHDISNLIMGVQGASELMSLADEKGMRELAEVVYTTSSRLAGEVAIQRALSKDDISEYELKLQDITAEHVVRELRGFFTGHPVASGKSLNLGQTGLHQRFVTDLSLLLRILTNMLMNALEATEVGGEVRFWVEVDEEAITFCVWNRQAIPEDVSLRVFQRHFSTKEDPGRGFGTYGMKLFGELYLGGKVSFTTSQSEGTVFRLRLPL